MVAVDVGGSVDDFLQGVHALEKRLDKEVASHDGPSKQELARRNLEDQRQRDLEEEVRELEREKRHLLDAQLRTKNAVQRFGVRVQELNREITSMEVRERKTDERCTELQHKLEAQTKLRRGLEQEKQDAELELRGKLQQLEEQAEAAAAKHVEEVYALETALEAAKGEAEASARKPEAAQCDIVTASYVMALADNSAMEQALQAAEARAQDLAAQLAAERRDRELQAAEAANERAGREAAEREAQRLGAELVEQGRARELEAQRAKDLEAELRVLQPPQFV